MYVKDTGKDGAGEGTALGAQMSCSTTTGAGHSLGSNTDGDSKLVNLDKWPHLSASAPEEEGSQTLAQSLARSEQSQK